MKIDLHYAFKCCDRHVEKSVERANPGVIYKDVNSPERISDRLYEEVGGRQIGHVAPNRNRALDEPFYSRHHAGGPGIVVQMINRNMRAVLRRTGCRRAANAPVMQITLPSSNRIKRGFAVTASAAPSQDRG